MVPIQTKMIDPKLMSASEVEWLDTYHTQVRVTWQKGAGHLIEARLLVVRTNCGA